MEDNLSGSNEPKKINLEDLTVPGVQKTEPVTLDIPAPEKLIADLQAAIPTQSQSKFKKVLVPIIAAVLVLAAGVCAGAYFFIFNGTPVDETHAAPDTTGTGELSDISKDLQEKLAPEDEISDTPVIEEPTEDTATEDSTAVVDNCGPFNADGTVDNCLPTVEPAITDDAADTATDTSDAPTQPVKRVKRVQ